MTSVRASGLGASARHREAGPVPLVSTALAEPADGALASPPSALAAAIAARAPRSNAADNSRDTNVGKAYICVGTLVNGADALPDRSANGT